MFVTPLVRQLVHSLRQQADLWERSGKSLRRDDGVEIQFAHSYEQRSVQARLTAPREVQFRGVEAWILKRAIRKWLHRPL